VSSVITAYVTPGLTFEQLNQQLYDASITAQLDDLFDAVMNNKSSTKGSTADGEAAPDADKPSGRTVTVAKSSKVAGFLAFALLLQGRVLLGAF